MPFICVIVQCHGTAQLGINIRNLHGTLIIIKNITIYVTVILQHYKERATCNSIGIFLNSKVPYFFGLCFFRNPFHSMITFLLCIFLLVIILIFSLHHLLIIFCLFCFIGFNKITENTSNTGKCNI